MGETLRLQQFGGDWTAVLRMADAVVPHDPEGNREWLANRRGFDDTARARRHYEVRDAITSEMVAYGALEQTEADTFRVFIVPADNELWDTAGTLLYNQLAAQLKALSATNAWLREYDTDTALIAFFTARGFVQDFHSIAYSGPAIAPVENGWALGYHASLRGDQLFVNVPEHLEQRFLQDDTSRGFERRYGTVRLVKNLV